MLQSSSTPFRSVSLPAAQLCFPKCAAGWFARVETGVASRKRAALFAVASWGRGGGGGDHCLIGITKGCPAYTPKEGMTEQRYSALLCRRKASYSPTRTTALVFFQFGRHHYRDPSENKVQRSPKKKEKKEKRPVCPLTLRREWRQHGRC